MTFSGFIVFVIVWVACTVSVGFFGFALGWLPALVLGYIVTAFQEL